MEPSSDRQADRRSAGRPDRPVAGQTYEAFGAYVRSQRQLAQLTLRQAAALARISNPYLSQIEHGMALPSVTVIRALAEALRVSADNLLLRAAGMATARPMDRAGATEDAIRHDQRLDDGQKQALLGVLAAFVGAAARPGAPMSPDDGAAVARAPRQRRPPRAPTESTEVRDHG